MLAFPRLVNCVAEHELSCENRWFHSSHMIQPIQSLDLSLGQEVTVCSSCDRICENRQCFDWMVQYNLELDTNRTALALGDELWLRGTSMGVWLVDAGEIRSIYGIRLGNPSTKRLWEFNGVVSHWRWMLCPIQLVSDFQLVVALQWTRYPNPVHRFHDRLGT